MDFLLIIGGLFVVAVLVFVFIYNGLVSLRQRVDNAWAQIDVQLTNAQVIALGTDTGTPQTLVAAPGANKAIIVHHGHAGAPLFPQHLLHPSSNRYMLESPRPSKFQESQ